MIGKYFFILILTLQYAFSDKSFTIVVDTTGSMKDEIEILKNNIEIVVDAARKRNFANYILLPFGDTNVGPPLITENPEFLIDLIDLVEVSGGHDCPEDSLAAIESALQISHDNSYIYVFTDAQAKDESRLETVSNLCQTRGSQVVIFQSGVCHRDQKGSAQFETGNTYYEIAKNCDGSVFHFNLGNFHHAFKYMKEITQVEWSDVNSHTELSGSKRFTSIMDVYTKDFLVAVSGNYPRITITNSNGASPHIEKIVDTHAFLVIRVKNPEVGELTTDVTSQGTAVATFYTKKEITFQLGFSPLKPKSLRETSSSPLPDTASYMLISLPQSAPIELISIQLQMTDTKETKTLEHHSLDDEKQLYIAEVFVERSKKFKVFIRCRDGFTEQEITGYSAVLEAQRLNNVLPNSIPSIELVEAESVLVDFDSSYTAACKIISNTKPEIWWENEIEETLTSESALLQIPSTYISYVKIDKINRNQTITCRCRYEDGDQAATMNLYVNRTLTFEVIQSPQDTTLEFGNEGKLFCEANTYPEADIKWYHNDTLIEESENLQIVNDEHMLLIKNMGLDDTGEYKCEIANSIKSETFLANVYITGLEPPVIEVEELEIVLKPGDFTEKDCTIIKGIPIPEVSWKYKPQNGDMDFDQVPDGVIVDGKSLKISAAEVKHEGFYVCEAVNLLGIDAQQLAVKVQYAPKIKNADEIKLIREGETVELLCEVDAVPKANVQWNVYQDDVIISLDNHHRMDDRNTLRFSARYSDSGMYHCLAENEMGRAIRIVTLNVLVAPYIEPIPWETLTIRAGTSQVLPCNVTYGNPVPSTKWEFISPKFDTTVLTRSRSMGSLDLVLTNVTRRQEGTYQCVSENEVAPDTIKVYLKVL